MIKKEILIQVQEGLKKLMETEDVTLPREFNGSYCVTIRMTNHEIELILAFRKENKKLKIEVEHGCEVNPSDWFDYDEYEKEEWEEKLNKLNIDWR